MADLRCFYIIRKNVLEFLGYCCHHGLTMKITFLGTGTSQGVPMIGCDCPVCVSDDPRNERFRTHIHVEMGGMNIQVDAAPEFRLQAIRHSIPKVDLIMLTHGHADHILGFDDMRRYCDMREGEAIPVYSNEEGLERLKLIFPYAICDRPVVKGYPAFSARLAPSVLEFEGGTIRTVVQSHGNFDTLGLVFEERESGRKFAYYTDCDSVKPEARALAAGADLLVVDGLRPMTHPSHMSIKEAIEASLDIGADRSLLIHMTHHVDHAETEATFPESVGLAYDNLVIELD